MPSTTLTIGAGERAALYAQATQNLSGIADVLLSFEHGDYLAARRLGNRAAQDIRLLNDLGWVPEDSRETFDLKMPVDELVSALARLREEAEGGLEEPDERRAQSEDERTRERYRHTAGVCRELIALIGAGGRRP
jgi:hypothetical protein